MKTHLIAIVVAIAASGIGAAATAGTALPRYMLGQAASAGQAGRTVVITPSTRYVNVTDGEVVTFVAKGAPFTWAFDCPPGTSSFRLNRVAPAGALDHPVTAYIQPNLEYYD
jgi:hypothetical protein